MKVMKQIDVKEYPDQVIVIEWVSSSTNDMIADSVITVLLRIEESPALVKGNLFSIHLSVPSN
jgi:cleavage and polyadenylation specificity factor subunit 3